MLDARFSHLYFCQSLYTLQRGLPAIAGLLVLPTLYNVGVHCSHLSVKWNWDARRGPVAVVIPAARHTDTRTHTQRETD